MTIKLQTEISTRVRAILTGAQDVLIMIEAVLESNALHDLQAERVSDSGFGTALRDASAEFLMFVVQTLQGAQECPIRTDQIAAEAESGNSPQM